MGRNASLDWVEVGSVPRIWRAAAEAHFLVLCGVALGGCGDTVRERDPAPDGSGLTTAEPGATPGTMSAAPGQNLASDQDQGSPSNSSVPGAPQDGAAATPPSGSTPSGSTPASTTPGSTTSSPSEQAAPLADAPAPTITSELSIETNPNNTLSTYVSWTTDEPSGSEVQFGTEGYEHRIVHPEPVTEHRVLVIGMVAETAYSIKAVSTNSGGSAEAEGSFTTGALPPNVPLPELTVHDPERMQPGWTLMNIQDATAGQPLSLPAILVMYNERGIPVWYHFNEPGSDAFGDVSADLLSNGNVLVGPSNVDPPREIDLGGELVWEGPPNAADGNPPAMSHHAGKLENGNYVLLWDIENNGIIGVLVEEVTPDNEVVASWNLFDHLAPPNAGEDGGMGPGGGGTVDWCHGNSVSIDLEEDAIYVSCRYLGIIKTQWSGEQAWHWHMPAAVDDAVGDLTFVPAEA